MKALRVLFIIPLIIFNVKADNSINIFIYYLQNKGYYDIILGVKFSLGKDVAIRVCFRLTENYGCDEVVRIYMPEGSNGKGGGISPSSVDDKIGPYSYKSIAELEKEFIQKLKKINASSDFKNKIRNIFNEANKSSKILVIIFINNYVSLRNNMGEEDIIKLIKKAIYTREKSIISEY